MVNENLILKSHFCRELNLDVNDNDLKAYNQFLLAVQIFRRIACIWMEGKGYRSHSWFLY